MKKEENLQKDANTAGAGYNTRSENWEVPRKEAIPTSREGQNALTVTNGKRTNRWEQNKGLLINTLWRGAGGP